MTVTTTISRVEYAGSGTTGPFSTNPGPGNGFYFNDDADVLVYLRDDTTLTATLQALTTDYTLSGAGNQAGGSVTMVSAVAAGTTVVIVHSPSFQQTLDLITAGKFPAESLESALDRATHQLQRIKDISDRSISLDDGDPATGSAYKANSNRIANLSDPENGQDATTKAWVSSQILAASLGGPISIAGTNVSYDNATSGLAATELQAAVDEIVATPAETAVTSGTFTPTWSGFSVDPDITFRWQKTTVVGGRSIVTISMSDTTSLTGTSNATTFTATGMEASVVPDHDVWKMILVRDNASGRIGWVKISKTTGNWTFYIQGNISSSPSGSIFNSSTTKGFDEEWSLVYDIP